MRPRRASRTSSSGSRRECSVIESGATWRKSSSDDSPRTTAEAQVVAVDLSILDLLRRISRPHDGVLGYVPGIAGMHDVTDWEGWPVERLRNDGGVSVEERRDKFRDYVGTMRAGTASMLQDMQKGIPCEKDYIPGRVIEVAEQHGVETPYTRIVHRLIAQAEEAGVLTDREAGRAELARLMRERGEG